MSTADTIEMYRLAAQAQGRWFYLFCKNMPKESRKNPRVWEALAWQMSLCPSNLMQKLNQNDWVDGLPDEYIESVVLNVTLACHTEY